MELMEERFESVELGVERFDIPALRAEQTEVISSGVIQRLFSGPSV